MSHWGDEKSLLSQRCAIGIAQLPSFQTKWIFADMHVLGDGWAVKLARDIQKLCTHSPPCKVPWQNMTLTGSASCLVLASTGCYTDPAAQQQHRPWEAELGDHQLPRHGSMHQGCGDDDGRSARAVLAGNTLLPHMLDSAGVQKTWLYPWHDYRVHVGLPRAE